MSARQLIAAADEVQERIAVAEKALTVLAEIKRRHAPVDCGLLSPVCGVCCRDEFDGAISQDCMASHDHAPDQPVCSTIEIIERAGL